MTRKSTAAVVTGMAALAAFATLGTGVAGATPGVPAPTFWSSGADAGSILLSPEAMAEITDTKTMEVVGSSDDLLDDSDRVEPAACVSAYSPAQAQSYAGSDWTAVNAELVADGEPGDATLVVTQSVVTFDSDDAAGDYLTQASKEWKRCGGTDLAITTKDGDVMEWSIGKPSLNDDETVIILPVAAQAGECERALAGMRDIVIDVMACSVDGGDATGQAEAVVMAIAEIAGAQPA